MATTAYHTPSSTRPRRPDPQRVYQTYQHECRARGEWGAFTRTAAHYHKPDGSPYSDEWARKLVKRYEAEQAARTVSTMVDTPADEVPAYEAPPGARPAAVPAHYDELIRQLRAAKLPTSALRLPTAEHDITIAASSKCADLHICQPAAAANFQPVALDEEPRIPDPNSQPDEPEPARAPDELPDLTPQYPADPFHPTQPATADPWELPSVGPRGQATPTPYPQPEPEPAPEPLPFPDPRPEPQPDPVPIPPMPGPNPRAIVVRQIVRVPADARNGGLLGWLAEHETARKQIGAWFFVALLILLCVVVA